MKLHILCIFDSFIKTEKKKTQKNRLIEKDYVKKSNFHYLNRCLKNDEFTKPLLLKKGRVIEFQAPTLISKYLLPIKN